MSRTSHTTVFCLALVFPFVLLLTIPVLAYSPEECIQCHGETGQSTLRISVADFRHSAHGSDLSCLDCHTGIQDPSHETLNGSSSVSCGECHDRQNRHGLEGKAELRPPCHSCHTKHRILAKENPASSVHPGALPRTCATCHPRESGRPGYLSWFLSLQVVSHGKADFSRRYGRDNCVGCHQGDAAHGEKNPIDPQECYGCHRSMWGSIHPDADPDKEPVLFAAALLYQGLALFLVLGGVLFYIQRFAGKRSGRR